MESATLTRPRPVARRPRPRRDRRSTDRWAWIAFAVLCVGAARRLPRVPDVPELRLVLLDALGPRAARRRRCPSYETYRAPTPHPLATAIGTVLSPLGHDAERLWILLCVVVVRRARRRRLPAGARGVHAARRPRRRARWSARASTSRSTPRAATSTSPTWRSSCGRRCSRRAGRGAGRRSSSCSRIAGMLRPEAWLMAGLYFLWVAWPARPGATRARYAALAAIGPVVWAGSDLIVTGDPLYSLTYTSNFAEELGRAKSAERPAPGDLGVPGQARQVPGAARRDRRPRRSRSSLVPRRMVMPVVAARRRHRHVRARRPRRLQRHRPLPARRVADGHGLLRASRWRGGRCSSEGSRRAAGVGGRGRRCSSSTASSSPRRASNLDRLRQRAGLPRRRARGAARRARRRRPSGAGCGAARSACPTTSSSPTCAGSTTCPTARVARAQRGATRRRRRPTARPRASRRDRRAAAWRSTRTSARRCSRQALVEETDDPATVLPAAPATSASPCPTTTPPMSAASRALTRRARGAAAPRGGLPRRVTPPRAARPRRAGRGGWRSALLLLVALLLRLWGADHGLPYAYNADENAHFVPRAIGLYGHEWNPDYFVNPPAYTYVLHLVFSVWFGGRDGRLAAVRHRPDRGVGRRARRRPRCSGRSRSGCSTSPARGCSTGASACSAAALAGRRVPAGLLLAPRAQRRARRSRRCASALWGVAGVLRLGPAARLRRSPGVGLGLACGDEVHGRRSSCCPLLVAAAIAVRRAGRARRWRCAGCSIAGGRAIAAFVVANPYARARLPRVLGRDHAPVLGGRRRDAGQARPDPRQRRLLLPVVVHLGARVDPAARGGRGGPAAVARRAPAGLGARPGDRCSSSRSWARRSATSAAG